MIKKVCLIPKTSFTSMFTADQLWGQFVWAISDLYGEEKASCIVDQYKRKPPILFSSVTIDGYLPKPFFIDDLYDSITDIGKHNKKVKWIDLESFSSVQNNCMCFTKEKLDISANSIIKQTNEVHVSIDRRTLTSMDKGLFNTRYFYSAVPLCFYINFIDSDEKYINLFTSVLDIWRKVGLGGDKNVGHGQFDIEISDLNTIEKKIFAYNSNTFVTISRCFGTDLVPLKYQMDVYWGVHHRNDLGLYRKKGILQYREGSLFLDGNGCLVESGFTSSFSTYSYGLSFPVFINYNEDY